MSSLSVIVPVYNVERWVDRCLESLEGQDLGDLEIVCVNDGSTDGSRARLSAWETRDPRVRVIDQPNRGVSSARNTGIKAARGDYVCFLDADDRLLPGACRHIVELLDRTSADVVVFGGRVFPAGAPCPEWLEESLHPRDVTYDGFSMGLLLHESSRPFAWKLALRRDFMRERGVLFDEGTRFGEDQVFCFSVYPRSRRTVFVSDELYEYQVSREGSLMRCLRDDFESKMLRHADVIGRILSDWSSLGILDEHASEMVGFALDFVLYDALKLEESAYLLVAERLRAVLSAYWGEDDLAKMSLSPDERMMALKACYHTSLSPMARRALALGHRLRQRGVRSLLRRVVQKLGRSRA